MRIADVADGLDRYEWQSLASWAKDNDVPYMKARHMLHDGEIEGVDERGEIRWVLVPLPRTSIAAIVK